MKIILVGGGSGGHLTPLVAVADAIKNEGKNIEVVVIGQRKENLKEVFEHDSISAVHKVYAGKFRRYHGESFISHILDVKTLYFNVRDFFRFIIGTLQSIVLLFRLKPDVIFLKGGFVSVPVGLAARLWKIPYVTHDSDAIPGLANRITSKHAEKNLVAMDEHNYPYPKEKIVKVGLPLRPEFTYVDAKLKSEYRKKLGLKDKDFVLFSVGGGLGAQKLNHALIANTEALLKEKKNLKIIHISGKKLHKETLHAYENTVSKHEMNRVVVVDFTTELYRYSGAADLVLTRAGATNLAEFSLQGKACLIVPNPVLTGGQQLHNARLIEKHKAAVILGESELAKLGSRLSEMINRKPKDLKILGDNFAKLNDQNSAKKISKILIDLAKAE